MPVGACSIPAVSDASFPAPSMMGRCLLCTTVAYVLLRVPIFCAWGSKVQLRSSLSYISLSIGVQGMAFSVASGFAPEKSRMSQPPRPL